jgi:putative Holliday junction resolvase
MARVVGLDVGDRYIGVAVSDPTGVLAVPRETLVGYSPSDLREYLIRLKQEGIEEVVVGLPITLSGKEGEQASKTREYVAALEGIEGLRVFLWDERLSSREAARRLREARGKSGEERIDAQAAAVILQSYLDAKAVRIDVDAKTRGPKVEGRDLT